MHNSNISTNPSARKNNMSYNPKPPPVKVEILHKDKIMLFMHEFIEKVVDVADDNHCELCVVVGLRDMCVDDYHIICYHILKEMIDDYNECCL